MPLALAVGPVDRALVFRDVGAVHGIVPGRAAFPVMRVAVVETRIGDTATVLLRTTSPADDRREIVDRGAGGKQRQRDQGRQSRASAPPSSSHMSGPLRDHSLRCRIDATSAGGHAADRSSSLSSPIMVDFRLTALDSLSNLREEWRQIHGGNGEAGREGRCGSLLKIVQMAARPGRPGRRAAGRLALSRRRS